jgi:cobalt-zinc-cadmium efflux system outer membrane protein
MKSVFRALILSSLIPLSTAIAGPALVVTPSTVADRVRAQNPDLAAARLRIAEALGRMKQAGRPENPRLETEFEHDPRFREGRFQLGFTQRFPVTSRLRLEKDLSATELTAAEAEVREVERRLVAQARTALVKALAVRQQRTLRRNQAEAAREFAAFISKAAEKGEGSPIDAGQAKLEAARLSAEMRLLDAEEAAAIGELKPLLGMPPQDELRASGELSSAALPGEAGDPSRRPDWQAAHVEVRAAETEAVLERAKRYDDLEAGVFLGGERREDAPEGRDNNAIIGLKLSIPLPLWDDRSGAIEAADAKAERKRLEVSALGESIRHEAAAAREEMAQWAKLEREIAGELLPLSGKQVEFAETAYRNGQGEIPAVFRAREQRFQLEVTRLNALREFHLARVRFLAALNRF